LNLFYILYYSLYKGWIDGFTILLSVLIIIVVSSTNNYLKDKQFENLFRQADKKIISVCHYSNVSFLKFQ